MIEVNLVPDVKQELIKAKQSRNFVVSSAILVSAASVGLVIILGIYALFVQPVRSSAIEGDIKKKSTELASKPDINNTLTIQNQLTKINSLHDSKNISSRLLEVLVAINPAAPNQATFSTVKLNNDTKTIRLEGQTPSGYDALEVLKKTILGTTFSFSNQANETITNKLTENVLPSDMSFGEDATGNRVLRFTLTFEYNEALFARTSKNTKIIRPDRKNVTDSYIGVPVSLFSDRATTEGGAN
jgi:hypothetical protein